MNFPRSQAAQAAERKLRVQKYSSCQIAAIADEKPRKTYEGSVHCSIFAISLQIWAKFKPKMSSEDVKGDDDNRIPMADELDEEEEEDLAQNQG